MEKYRFYHDAETYITHKTAEAAAQHLTAQHEHQALAMLKEFLSRPGIITQDMTRSAIKCIESMDAPGAAEMLFAKALKHTRDECVTEKVAFFAAARDYIADEVAKSGERVISDG
jgi:hypothetical protein